MAAFRTAAGRALPMLMAALLPSLLSSLLLPLPARAERFALATDRDAAYYAVTLDADVYAHSTRPGLADLRVRNEIGRAHV